MCIRADREPADRMASKPVHSVYMSVCFRPSMSFSHLFLCDKTLLLYFSLMIIRAYASLKLTHTSKLEHTYNYVL